jgi:spermidine/putrescine transport system permease protein
MATVATRERVTPETGGGGGAAPPRRSARRWIGDHLILVVGILVLIYMFVPIGYIFALSFSQPSSRSATAEFEQFTWNNWTTICQPQGLCESLRLSLLVGLTSTVIATILGTLMAFALVRHSFRGRSSSNLLIFLPMATPEVVMGGPHCWRCSCRSGPTARSASPRS